MELLSFIFKDFTPYVTPFVIGYVWGRQLNWRLNFCLMLAVWCVSSVAVGVLSRSEIPFAGVRSFFSIGGLLLVLVFILAARAFSGVDSPKQPKED